ncbi:MAG: carboxypeptidase regulatory-like domain-containing protein [Methanobrevibacter sp.]|nr:carboxypeptidase regulatory-like domain-containing protein [Methanobrevibacter sp.]
MDRNKIIIIALIVVIAALLVGVVALAPNMAKKDTKLTFKSNSSIDEGGSIKIKLSDSNGNAIAGQKVNVTVTDKDKASSYYSVETNDNGVGTLKMDKDAGKYDVTVTYGGSNDYKGCNATKKITVKEETAEAEQTSSSSSSSSSKSAYAYKSDGTPMYSQAEVDQYMVNKYGYVNYHIGSNGYVDMDEPGYGDDGHRIW